MEPRGLCAWLTIGVSTLAAAAVGASGPSHPAVRIVPLQDSTKDRCQLILKHDEVWEESNKTPGLQTTGRDPDTKVAPNGREDCTLKVCDERIGEPNNCQKDEVRDKLGNFKRFRKCTRFAESAASCALKASGNKDLKTIGYDCEGTCGGAIIRRSEGCKEREADGRSNGQGVSRQRHHVARVRAGEVIRVARSP
jgi:hypothetical protein